MDPASDTQADAPTTGEVVDSATGKPKLETILTFPQVHAMYKNFVKDNRLRNNKNSAIQRKRDGEQPFPATKLRAANQSWRNNRPTGFMQSMLKRLMPPYKQMVDQLPMLTFTHFPSEHLGTEQEQDIFRQGITDAVRSWPGWSELMSQIIDEDITFGYAAAAPTDEWTWKLKMFRGDEAYFYVGCPQLAKECEVWFYREDMQVHDAIKILRGGKASHDAGWHLKNLVNKLNGAKRQYDDYTLEENSRVFEDLWRENSIAATFNSTIKVLKTATCLVVDPEGGVNKYVFDRDDGTPLFFRRNLFSSMEKTLVLFSAEVGDGTLHGSRGAGRALYNTHVSVEQARNFIMDALMLSGLLILKRTQTPGAGSTQTPALSVMHPFAIIETGYEALENVSFTVNHEAFLAMDRQATMQAEIQVGAFMPGQIMNDEGDKRTASEVNYTASIDAQIRAGVLARFADQVFNLMDLIQRRICHPDVVRLAGVIRKTLGNSGDLPIYDEQFWRDLQTADATAGFQFFKLPNYVDEDALNCVLKMMEQGLTAQKILVLANQSSRASVEDAIASQSGIYDLILARYGADPMIDAVELKRRDLASKVGASAADRLMEVDKNPYSPIKQVRTQLTELATMLAGNDMPVDPMDDDKVHLLVIAERIRPMLADVAIAPLAGSLEFLKRVIGHADQHIASAQKKGIKPQELADILPVIEEIRTLLAQEPQAIDQGAMAALNQGGAGGGPAPALATDVPFGAPPAPVEPELANPVAGTIGAVASPPRPTPPTAA